MGELQEVKVYLSTEGSETLFSDKPISSPDDAIEVISKLLGKQDREFLCVVNLDIKNRPINYHIVTIGTINKTIVDVGNLFKTALLSNSSKVMVFHNHPSGDPTPSQDDIDVTRKIVSAGQILDIKVIDHVIIGGKDNNYFSICKNNPSLFSNEKSEVINIGQSVAEKSIPEYSVTASRKDEFRKALAEQFIRLLDPDNDTDEMNWIKEWNGSSTMPENMVTGKKYRGINRICLFLVANEKGYKDPRWATISTIKKLSGAKVKKGEHGTKVEYWFTRDFGLEKNDPNYGKSYTFSQVSQLIKNEGRKWTDFVPYPRYYTVFNAEQCDGIPPLAQQKKKDITQEKLVWDISESMRVDILNDGGNNAFYLPSEDSVHLPDPSSFVSSYAYNSTALHELAHSTGAANRLNRNLSGLFGSEDYAFEELVAEMTSCMVSTNFAGDDAGVDEYLRDHGENHKRYVKSWAKSISDNPNCLVQAIKCAETAADFLEMHGGLMDINTFNKYHGHEVTVMLNRDNQISVSSTKTSTVRGAIDLENTISIQENQEKQTFGF